MFIHPTSYLTAPYHAQEKKLPKLIHDLIFLYSTPSARILSYTQTDPYDFITTGIANATATLLINKTAESTLTLFATLLSFSLVI